ncbi:hypothetical protein GCWU000324_02050 [Kingella oralis ATCC 51147]|uniref:Uncharacterized protein n=2 Tax=Kingella TaxID=32257 RepID=C4GJ27_9NEIS|nr:hypothetical protein GCWU000324_02050 [Kingella oralis ATCC 51147]
MVFMVGLLMMVGRGGNVGQPENCLRDFDGLLASRALARNVLASQKLINSLSGCLWGKQ